MIIVDRYIKQVDVYLRVNEKKIVACRYISVIIARVRRRVSCQIIGRLCEPIIRERKRKRKKERKIWNSLSERWELIACCACTWEYVLMWTRYTNVSIVNRALSLNFENFQFFPKSVIIIIRILPIRWAIRVTYKYMIFNLSVNSN